MDKGFITLSRSITDNFLWNCEPFSRGQAWVDLLLKANYKSNRMIIKNGTFIDVERGQVASGISKISKDWNWDRRKVKRFINELEKQEMVQQKNVGNHTIITILNYEYYQSGTTNGTTNGITNSTTNSTITGTTNGTTFNKENNVNNENNDNNMYIEPTENQIEFAKSLGIKFDGLSKFELSKKINEVKNKNNGSSSYIEPDYEEPNKTITSKFVFDKY